MPDTQTLSPVIPASARRAAVAAPASVFVALPVYNEATVIRAVIDEVIRFADSHPEYTFLFVDDGSSDNTADIIRDRLRESPRPAVDLFRMRGNAGKGDAVHAAFCLAKADVLLFTDGDLAYSLDLLPSLVAALQHADVAIGSRGLVSPTGRRENIAPLRRIMGWTFNRLARLVLGLPHQDTQAGLKGFRAHAAEAIFRRRRLRGFAFDVELLFLARRLGLRVAEVPATPSPAHVAMPSSVRLLRDPVVMFGALFAVRLNALLGRYA